MADQSWGRLRALKSANLKTARAWAIKTHAMCLWGYRSRAWARKAWMAWYGWAVRSHLALIKKVARTAKAHLEGILTAVVTGATHARAEGFNTTIQKIKRDARGFRNKERFKAAIYFHLGGLDLYPDAVRKRALPTRFSEEPAFQRFPRRTAHMSAFQTTPKLLSTAPTNRLHHRHRSLPHQPILRRDSSLFLPLRMHSAAEHQARLSQLPRTEAQSTSRAA